MESSASQVDSDLDGISCKHQYLDACVRDFSLDLKHILHFIKIASNMRCNLT